MRSLWYKPIVLESLDDSWDSSPASAGVYIIMSDRPIPRIGRVDDKGIIYIGKAKNLRNRLWRFLKIQHTASDFLWAHPTVAGIVLNKPIRTFKDVGEYLGKLQARYSTPIDEQLLDKAERALVFAYIQCFGEAPPLNLSLPKRWDDSPPSQDLLWAEKGLFS